jgi:hypothetical protein
MDFQEVARPQSEERNVLRERLTTEMLTSISAETLSVIKEDEDDMSIPQCFDIDCSVVSEVESQPHSVDLQDSLKPKQPYIAKLNESSFIDIFSIESKIEALSVSEIEASKKISGLTLELATEGPVFKRTNDIHLANTEPIVDLKDRVLALVAVIIIVVYFVSSVTFVGWFGIKTVQSVRHFVAPAPSLVSFESFQFLNTTNNEWNASNGFWTEGAGSVDNTDHLHNASNSSIGTDELAVNPIYLDIVPSLGTSIGKSNEHISHRLVRDTTAGMPKSLASSGSLIQANADKLLKPILLSWMDCITIMLSRSTSKLKDFREKRMLQQKTLPSVQQALKVVVFEVGELIDEGYYFI